jgi:shikimate kinase
MGSGKTVVGKTLAERLGWKFIDTDDLIEEKAKMKIKDIFAKHGEPFFRDLETKVIEEISTLDNTVISLGGGAVLREKNIQLVKKNGIIINLRASPKTIFSRTCNTDIRPLLNKPNPMEEIDRLLSYRKPYYDKCDWYIETDNLTVEEVVEKIINYLKEAKKWEV